MSDQVQHLIDRIRKDAVETSRGEAAQIQQQAKEEARRTEEAAQIRAQALVAEAEQKAAALLERGNKALEQAARDLLLAIGGRLEALVDDLLASAAKEALRPEVVEQMLLRLCDGLARSGFDEKSLMVSVSPGERDQIARFAMGQLRQRLKQGIEVHIDLQLQQGFQLSLGDNSVHHDFTPAAIAAVLAQFVRPELGAVVQRAARGSARP